MTCDGDDDNDDKQMEKKCRFTTINKISSKIGKNAYEQKKLKLMRVCSTEGRT